MSKTKLKPKTIMSLVISLIIFGVLAILVPWGQVLTLLHGLKISDLIILLIAGGLYYIAKATRFWMMLKALDYGRPIGIVSLLYLSAQPATLIPGGDLYRTVSLKEHAGIPIHKSSSAIVLQAVVEAFALVVVGLAGALLTGENVVPVIIVMLIFGAIVFILSKGWIPTNPKLLNRLPMVKISKTKLAQFKADNKILLRPWNFGRLFSISLVPILSGVIIVFVSAHAVGVHFSWLQSVIAYSLPSVIAYVAFLPGTGEGGSIGILALLGANVPSAVAITLLLRLFTVGLGLVLGPVAILARRKANLEVMS